MVSISIITDLRASSPYRTMNIETKEKKNEKRKRNQSVPSSLCACVLTTDLRQIEINLIPFCVPPCALAHTHAEDGVMHLLSNRLKWIASSRWHGHANDIISNQICAAQNANASHFTSKTVEGWKATSGTPVRIRHRNCAVHTMHTRNAWRKKI